MGKVWDLILKILNGLGLVLLERIVSFKIGSGFLSLSTVYVLGYTMIRKLFIIFYISTLYSV